MIRELLTNIIRAQWPKRERSPFLVDVAISVDQMALRIANLYVHSAANGHAKLVVEIDVPDQRDGDPSRITFTADIEWEDDTRARAEVIRKALGQIMCHEVDESIRVCGEKVFDPHLDMIGPRTP